MTVLGAIGALIIGLAGPASAVQDTETGFDARGDARAKLDITKVRFRLNAEGARAKIFVRNLRPRGEFVFAVTNRSQSRRFGLAATGRRDAPTVKRFFKFRDGELSRKRCERTRVGWHGRRDVVTMWFPSRCFRALPRRIKMAVGSTRNFPDGRTVDEGPVVLLRR